MHERPRYLVAIYPRRPQRGSGLSVVRLLIEAMDDRLQVAAHPRGGADVQRLLPIARTQHLVGQSAITRKPCVAAQTCHALVGLVGWAVAGGES
jgi:hypothetical protein